LSVSRANSLVAADLRHYDTRLWPYVMLLASAAALFLLELKLGAVDIPVRGLLSILSGADAGHPSWPTILLQLRMPRALTAAIAGAGLAVCGLMLQTLFRNPLAGPWAMGITGGAQVGVALVVVAGNVVGPRVLDSLKVVGNISMTAAAGLGSAVVLFLMVVASRRLNAVTLLIAGLMFGFFAQGATSILLHFTSENQAKIYGSWNEANYSAVAWEQMAVLAPLVLIGLFIAGVLAKPLNALLLGENYAQSLGLPVRRNRGWAFTAVALIAGAVTAHCGPIMFIDILVPHICRGLFRTSDHRALMPAVVLGGSILGLAADVFVNAPWEQHFLHINALNAVLGAPIVVWVIARHMTVIGNAP
jgi:iron complex transport system permease protein